MEFKVKLLVEDGHISAADARDPGWPAVVALHPRAREIEIGIDFNVDQELWAGRNTRDSDSEYTLRVRHMGKMKFCLDAAAPGTPWDSERHLL